MKKLRHLLVWLLAFGIGFGLFYGIQHSRNLRNTVSAPAKRDLQEQEPEGYTFYYDQLSMPEQKAYRAVLYGVSHNQAEFYIGNDYTTEELKRVMYAFTYDYPEYYWCLRYQTEIYRDKAYFLVFEEDANRAGESEKLRTQADSIVQGISEKKGQYKQIKAIYDYIIEHTDYVENSQYDQDIRSVLLNHQSVCSGYARTFQYLCKLMGIACTTVNGYSLEKEGVRVPHAWNLLCVKDQYYWLDVTWGDSRENSQGKYVNYSYFMSADDPFLNLHKIDEYMDYQTRETTLFTYPECKDDSLNYYNKKGCYFRSYHKTKVRQYISSRLRKDLHAYIELQFADKKAYQKAYQDLVQDLNIETIYKDYIPYNTKVSYEYGCDADSYLLVFTIP